MPNPLWPTRRLVLPLLALVALAAGCPSGGRSKDALQGTIKTMKDQELRPIGQAQVMIRPKTIDPAQKGADEQPEDPQNLRGVAITNDTGFFQIGNLTSEQTFSEYGLLRNWKYELTIQVPGYYTYKGEFTYLKGAQQLDLELEEKATDVLDEGGVITIDEKSMQTGAVRRGN